MVYCGKPSAGCENCRNLHTKCDQKYPSCSRCVRMKRKCVGYRDQSKLLFRDETAKTQNKVRRRRVDWNPKFPTHVVLSPSPLLAPQSQDVAVWFFYHTTLSNLSEKDPARHLQMHLPNLYAKSRIGSALRLATESISHALAPDFVPEANRTARKRYGEALDAIQQAIQDPVDAKNDETLYAILLLCGYETMTRETALPSAWGTHVGGAAALVRYRGSSQQQSQLAQGLFCFVRKSIVLSHMQACHAVDEVFTQPSIYEDPENQLVAIASRIPKLQQIAHALLSPSGAPGGSHLRELVHNAKMLDQDLLDWGKRLPESWSYALATEITTTSDPAEFSPKHIHRYPDFYVARVWNFYRISRLILQSLLYRATLFQTLEGSKNIATDKAKTQNNIHELVEDICGSVAFLLGHDLSRMTIPATSESRRQHQEWEGPLVNGGDGDQPKLSPTTGSFSLIWPLYVASSAMGIPDDQRQWIHRQLQTIAANGDSQAQLALANKSRTLLGGPELLQFDCV